MDKVVDICFTVTWTIPVKQKIALQVLMQASVLNCNMEREYALNDCIASHSYISRCTFAYEQLDRGNRQSFSSMVERKLPMLVHKVQYVKNLFMTLAFIGAPTREGSIK